MRARLRIALSVIAVWQIVGELVAQEPPEPSVPLDSFNACGVTCLYSVSRLLRVDARFDEIHNMLGDTKDAMHSMLDLSRAAAELGLCPLAMHLSRSELSAVPTPAIAHMRLSADKYNSGNSPHFVVLLEVDDKLVRYLDPPFPITTVEREYFESVWSGDLLLFLKDMDEKREVIKSFEAKLSPLRVLSMCEVSVLAVWALALIVSRRRLAYICRSTGRAINPHVVFLVVLSSGVAACALLALPYMSRRPVWDAPEAQIDLGVFPLGSASATIPVKNSGKAPLLIKEVKSSCGCAVVRAPDRIAAGQIGDIHITLDVSRRISNATLLFSTNESLQRKAINIVWRTPTEDHISVVPAQIRDLAVPCTRNYQQMLQLTYVANMRGSEPEIIDWKSDIEGLALHSGKANKIAYRTAREPGFPVETFSTLNLNVVCTPPKKAGVRKGIVKCKVLVNDEEHTFSIPVEIGFIGRLRPSQKELIFSSVTKERLIGQKRTLKIDVAEGDCNTRLRVVDSPSWINAHIRDTCGIERFVDVTVSDAPIQSFTSGALTLELLSENREQAVVPIVGLIADKGLARE